MGRASRADAAKHREDVVNATAKLLRERGSAGASVQEVMSTVGLTHGGFYKHFASKDALMGIAAATAFSELLDQLTQISDDFPDRAQARSELLGEYLSTQHRDSPGTGCAGTALAGDAARAAETSPLRRSYVEGVESALELLAELEKDPATGDAEARRRAIFAFSSMVGALTLARATGRTPLSEEILHVAQESLAPQP
jgi:TetR/AcrR family transcriptional repressor of nem operon